MLGPVPAPVSSSGPEFTPLANPVPYAGETKDNPRQPIRSSQPVELPTDRVDLPGETRNPAAKPGEGESSPATAETSSQRPVIQQSSVTFRVLRGLDVHIQSRVVDRVTREVVRSVPPDQLIDFYERFPPAGLEVDIEA